MVAQNSYSLPTAVVTGPAFRPGAVVCALAFIACLASPLHAQVEVEVGTTESVTAKPSSSVNGSSQTITSHNASAAALAAGSTSSTSGTMSNLKQDAEADQAASKILPAPGTILQSTENSSLGVGAVTAPTPSLTFTGNSVTMASGAGTSETVAVHTGAELMRLLGLQRKANPVPASESEETTAALFDVSAVERLKGDKPTVVYRVIVEETPLPDPMIVPWIRQAKLLQERFDKAVEKLSSGQVAEARQDLLGIMTDFPDTDYAKQAEELTKKLDELSKVKTAMPVIATPEPTPGVSVQLSPDVKIGTVMVDPSDVSGNRVMIANRIYKVGDPIKGIPNHTVVGISVDVVKVEVTENGQTKVFDVPVRPVGMN